jgi:hypothetical protein
MLRSTLSKLSRDRSPHEEIVFQPELSYRPEELLKISMTSSENWLFLIFKKPVVLLTKSGGKAPLRLILLISVNVIRPIYLSLNARFSIKEK